MTERTDIADPARPLIWLTHCPAHAATPLHDLVALASQRGWAACHVKDKTVRMGAGLWRTGGNLPRRHRARRLR